MEQNQKVTISVSLKFLSKWWESLTLGIAITLILAFLAGFNNYGQVLLDTFIIALSTAFTLIIILRFYRQTELFTTKSELMLVTAYSMIITSTLVFLPLILYQSGYISQSVMYGIYHLVLYRIKIPNFNIVYGFYPTLIVLNAILTLLFYIFSVSVNAGGNFKQNFENKFKTTPTIKTGTINTVTRNFFEAYDVWIFTAVLSLGIIFVTLALFNMFFMSNIEPLKWFIEEINHMIPPQYPAL